MRNYAFAVGIALAFIIGHGGAAIAGDPGPVEHCKESKSQVCGQEMGEMSQRDHAGHEGMHHGHGASKDNLDWAGMSRHMVPMMKTMTGMTQRLGVIMASERTSEKMAEVGELMDVISTHMLRMADAMNNGGASEAEMHSLHMGIDDTLKRLEKFQ